MMPSSRASSPRPSNAVESRGPECFPPRPPLDAQPNDCPATCRLLDSDPLCYAARGRSSPIARRPLEMTRDDARSREVTRGSSGLLRVARLKMTPDHPPPGGEAQDDARSPSSGRLVIWRSSSWATVAQARAPVETLRAPLRPSLLIERKTPTTIRLSGMPKRFMMTPR